MTNNNQQENGRPITNEVAQVNPIIPVQDVQADVQADAQADARAEPDPYYQQLLNIRERVRYHRERNRREQELRTRPAFEYIDVDITPRPTPETTSRGTQTSPIRKNPK